MKVKYTGDLDAVTVRGVTFEKGKTVELDENDSKQASLAAKMLAWPEVEEVKRGRKPNAENVA